MFSDKLTNLKDKAVYASYMEAQLAETFGPDMTAQCKESFYMVNFLRPDVFDEEGVLVQEAPKMYEPGGKHYYFNTEDFFGFLKTMLYFSRHLGGSSPGGSIILRQVQSRISGQENGACAFQ